MSYDAKLRFGITPGILCWPFRHALSSVSGVEVISLPFEALAQGVRRQELDCALVPVLDALRLSLSVAIPGAGVATAHGLRIASAAPLPGASRIGVPAGLGSAVGLAQVVLQERWGTAPVFEEVREGDLLETYDGVLLEDDHAVAPDMFTSVCSVGELWEQMTGLPCVQALWLACFRAPLPDLRRHIGMALQRLPDIGDPAFDDAAAAFGIDKTKAGTAIAASTYRFGGAEMESVRLFAALAIKHGLCGADAAVTFC